MPHELLHEGEADAGSFEAATFRALDALKAVEDVRQLVRGDAGAGIANRELDAIATRAQAHGDFSSESKLERVRDQVEDDLLPLRRVDVGRFL